MTRETHTPIQRFRLETELWDAFGRLVGTRQRSGLIRDFIRWYLREPGAKLPDRPKPQA